MKIVLLFLFLSFIALFAASQTNTVKNNEMIIRKKTIDFGVVKQDTLLTAKFYLVNNSDRKIIINYVNPDCSCTKFLVSNYNINPHDSVYVDLSLDTKNRFGEQKLYTIIKAETNTKMYKLTLKAFVK
jgi:hypothetical protein